MLSSEQMESKMSDLRGEEMTMDSVSLAAGFLLALLGSLRTEIRSLIGKGVVPTWKVS